MDQDPVVPQMSTHQAQEQEEYSLQVPEHMVAAPKHQPSPSKLHESAIPQATHDKYDSGLDPPGSRHCLPTYPWCYNDEIGPCGFQGSCRPSHGRREVRNFRLYMCSSVAYGDCSMSLVSHWTLEPTLPAIPRKLEVCAAAGVYQCLKCHTEITRRNWCQRSTVTSKRM